MPAAVLMINQNYLFIEDLNTFCWQWIKLIGLVKCSFSEFFMFVTITWNCPMNSGTSFDEISIHNWIHTRNLCHEFMKMSYDSYPIFQWNFHYWMIYLKSSKFKFYVYEYLYEFLYEFLYMWINIWNHGCALSINIWIHVVYYELLWLMSLNDFRWHTSSH